MRYQNYETVERNIGYNKISNSYVVRFRFEKEENIQVFPTLEDARKYRDAVNEEKLKVKILEATIKTRKEEIKLLKESKEEYPFNLVDLLKERYNIEIYDIDESMDALAPRELLVVKLYFEEKKTLEQTGNEIGVTRERVRQILTKALRRIVNRHKAIERQKAEQLIIDQEQERTNQLLAQRERLIIELKENGYLEETEYKEAMGIVEEDYTPFSEISIDELDLSVRSWHCLKRAGFKTVGELLELYKKGEFYDTIYKIRNLGRKSLNEIVYRLNLYLKEKGRTDELLTLD